MTALSRLSPQRRRVVVALLVVLAVVAVGIGAGTFFATRGGPGALARVGPAPQGEPGPVVLVPGYGGNRGSLALLADRLRADGRTVTVLTLPGDGTGDLEAQAALLDTTVEDLLRRTGAPSVDLVGYSAGGVVVRLWAKEYDADLARRIVMLGAPSHGASVAGLAGAFVPGACPVGCQQLSPGSALLDQLNTGDETPGGPAYLSVFSSTDEIVTPPETSRVSGATNVLLQDVCPGVTVRHGGLPNDPLPVALTLAALGPGPVPDPVAGDCTGTLALAGATR